MAMTHSAAGAAQVTVDTHAAVATVVLNHPGRMNAITVAMWHDLARIFQDLSGDGSLRCVVVSGANGHFAAGADIREFPQYRFNQDSVMAYHRDTIAPALLAIQQCPHPVIAAIQGVCVGGGLELASCCDLRLATQEARFGAPINRLGFPMAPDEMAGLLALAGRAVTLEILLEGRIFSADEARAKGLLTRVVPKTELQTELAACVQRICAGAPVAARLNKKMAARLSLNPEPLSNQEWLDFFSYADSTDHKKGVQAFLDGAEPVFTGD